MKRTISIALMVLSALALAKGMDSLIPNGDGDGLSRANWGSVLFPLLIGFCAWKAYRRTRS